MEKPNFSTSNPHLHKIPGSVSIVMGIHSLNNHKRNRQQTRKHPLGRNEQTPNEKLPNPIKRQSLQLCNKIKQRSSMLQANNEW